MRKPTFKEAADALCLTGQELANLLGISVQRVKQARMDRDRRDDKGRLQYRPPPAGWEAKLAKIARTKGKALERLAAELEALLRAR